MTTYRFRVEIEGVGRKEVEFEAENAKRATEIARSLANGFKRLPFRSHPSLIP